MYSNERYSSDDKFHFIFYIGILARNTLTCYEITEAKEDFFFLNIEMLRVVDLIGTYLFITKEMMLKKYPILFSIWAFLLNKLTKYVQTNFYL